MKHLSVARHLLIGFLVLALVLGGATGVSAQSGATGGQNPIDAFQSAPLLEKAKQQGHIRVILTVLTGFEPEGLLAGTAAVDAQRSQIASAQSALLDRIGAYALDEPYRFTTVPQVVVTLAPEGLQAAFESGLVAAAQEDTLAAPTLAESTVLIGATAAWSSGYSGVWQTIAILDTGVDKSHAFLAGKVISEGCYSSTDPAYGSTSVCPGGVIESTAPGSGAPCNLAIAGCEHGTHVAGIAAGNGASYSGVARGANLIAIQVFSRFDSLTYCNSGVPCALTFTSDQIKGLERVYMLRNTYRIAAVNMSLGGVDPYSANCDGDVRKPIIDQLRAAGVATVIAAGNNSFANALSAPACISSAISVGSTGDGSGGATVDAVSYFSNSASFLTLLAPGAVITSSVPGGGYANLSGTSMAAPHVAGAVALLRSRNLLLSVDAIQAALVNTGVPVTLTRGSVTVTKARIRLAQALASVPLLELNHKTYLPLAEK